MWSPGESIDDEAFEVRKQKMSQLSVTPNSQEVLKKKYGRLPSEHASWFLLATHPPVALGPIPSLPNPAIFPDRGELPTPIYDHFDEANKKIRQCGPCLTLGGGGSFPINAQVCTCRIGLRPVSRFGGRLSLKTPLGRALPPPAAAARGCC